MGVAAQIMKRHTFIATETAFDVGIGFGISWAVTYWILPYWGFEPSVRSAIEVTLLYTGTSIIRKYGIRWIFEILRGIWK